MILADVYSEVGKRCALVYNNTTDQAKMLSAINNQLRRLFLNTSLESERETFSLATVDGTHTYQLDSRVLRGINFRESSSPIKLDFKSRNDFEKEYPYPATTEEGLPTIYVPMRKIRVTKQPTAASAISVTSTSASDTAVYFVVKGYNASGQLITERLVFTGVTAKVTTASFVTLLSISKDTTAGTVTATSNLGVVTNITLLPGEKQKEHWEIRLHKIPDDAYTIYYSAQVIPWIMSYGEESLPIPDEYTENFLASATAEVLFIQGDTKAGIWDQKSEKCKDEIKDQNFFGEEEDARMGFGDMNYSGNFS